MTTRVRHASIWTAQTAIRTDQCVLSVRTTSESLLEAVTFAVAMFRIATDAHSTSDRARAARMGLGSLGTRVSNAQTPIAISATQT